MTPDEMKQQISEQRDRLKAEMKKLRQEFQEKSKAFFTEASKTLFENFPQLQSFAWSQGEHYNDEGYEFSADTYSESLWINGFHGYDKPDEGRSSYEIKKDIDKFSDRPTIVEELKKELAVAEAKEQERESLCVAVSNMLECFDNDDYEIMFGDGYKITVNRDGTVDVEAYDSGY